MSKKLISGKSAFANSNFLNLETGAECIENIFTKFLFRKWLIKLWRAEFFENFRKTGKFGKIQKIKNSKDLNSGEDSLN